MIKLLFMVVISIISLNASVGAADPPAVFNPPETLIYDVTYAGGEIAVLEFTESSPYSFKGQQVRELECRVESSGLFNLNGDYRSVVTDDYTPVYLRSEEGTPGDKRIIEYHFDHGNRSATVVDSSIKGADTAVTTRTLNDIDKRYFDSVSMIFKIRYAADTMRVPTYLPIFINGIKDSVLIESISPVQAAGPDGAPVDATLIRASLPYPPFPGFGDGIELYIARDEERTPLRGRIEMTLGYIEIKLRPR